MARLGLAIHEFHWAEVTFCKKLVDAGAKPSRAKADIRRLA
jgi:hypothetical protein